MSLFDKIDETAASDADYITTSTAGSVAELKLGPVADPGVDTGHSIKVRASGSGTLGVDLVQGNGASMMIWTSRTRTRQPPGPLLLTEKAAWVFLPTVPVELVSKTPITYGSSGSTYSADEEGRALDTTASAGGNLYAEIAHSTQIQIPPGSAVFVMRVKMAANLGARISKTTANGATDNEFDFIAYEYLGAGVLTVALTRVGGGGSRAWGVLESAYRPPSNKWVTLAVYAPSVVDSPSVFFADGVRLTATDLGGSGSGAPDTSTQPIRFNKRDDLTTSNDQSKIAVAYAIPGGNEAMAQRLSRTPWQLFAPTKRPIYFQTQKLIASRTIPLIATPTDYRRELLPAEAALITDYADLRVRFRGV